MKKRLVVVVAALMISGLTACMNWQEASSKQPDEVLFTRALDAIERQKYDVARLTLETLLNAYPDSEYASRAVELLDDPRMPKCEDMGVVGGECRGGAASQKFE